MRISIILKVGRSIRIHYIYNNLNKVDWLSTGFVASEVSGKIFFPKI